MLFKRYRVFNFVIFKEGSSTYQIFFQVEVTFQSFVWFYIFYILLTDREFFNNLLPTGNENIHRITRQKHYQLRVDMQDMRHHWRRYSVYNTFKVADRDHGYRLTATGYHGNGGIHKIYCLLNM